ncbi:MAG: phage tail tip lysozyme [Myxococcaceae bacterium]
MSTYTVRSGDSLSAIASRYHSTVAALAKANKISNVNLIRVGQKLVLPGSSGSKAKPSGSSVRVPAENLKRGMKSTAVRDLQGALMKLGYLTKAQISTGPGTFGPRTEAAVKKFQSGHGISATGNYGPQTRAALAKALGTKPTGTKPSGSKPSGSKPPTSSSGSVGGIENRPGYKGSGLQAIKFFMSKGLTRAQAAGIAGNLLYESGFNPKAVGDGGTSFGIAQWHFGRGAAMKSWTVSHGYSSTSFKGQLDFLWYELNHSESYALGKLRSATTAYNAGITFEKYFERPAQINPARGSAAQNFYNQSL